MDEFALERPKSSTIAPVLGQDSLKSTLASLEATPGAELEYVVFDTQTRTCKRDPFVTRRSDIGCHCAAFLQLLPWPVLGDA